MKRKQNYQTCPWCVKLAVADPIRRARHQALDKHMKKCKARYQLVMEKIPSRSELLEMLITQEKTTDDLQKRLKELEKTVLGLEWWCESRTPLLP